MGLSSVIPLPGAYREEAAVGDVGKPKYSFGSRPLRSQSTARKMKRIKLFLRTRGAGRTFLNQTIWSQSKYIMSMVRNEAFLLIGALF